MKEKSTGFNIAKYLRTEKHIRLFLQAIIQDATTDDFIGALDTVA